MTELPEGGPQSRNEQYLATIAQQPTELPEGGPQSENEIYLAKLAGLDVELPPEGPQGRNAKYLAYIIEHGGGGDITTEELEVDENGTYTAPLGKAYTPVKVNVPQPSGSVNITENGTVDVKDYETAVVNVPNPSTGSLNITENGIYDVIEKASANVNVRKAVPIEVSTAAEMDDVLISSNLGKAYKFTGTTDDTYTNGDIYVVEESA